MSPEKRVAMVKAALAEAGYPGADVTPLGDREFVRWGVAPPEVVWRAGAFVSQHLGRPAPCWPCWRQTFDGRMATCTHDTWEGAPPVRSRA